MNKQTVGMENLPNVFIDKINVVHSVMSNGRKQFNIKVTLMMVDDAFDRSWFGKIDDLKVKCSFVRDDRIFQQLNSGELSLYDFTPGSIDSTFVECCNEFVMYKRESGYDYYRKTIEFSEINSYNLNVYVAAFIDDLGFGISLFDKFYGPMEAEKIMVAGQVNTESGYFYYPDTNEEYGGPVHTHNQGYMEGSEHSDEPHSRLVYVPEENYKITSNQDLGLDISMASVFELGIDSDNILDPPDPSRVTLESPFGATLAPDVTTGNQVQDPLANLEIVFPNQLIRPPGGY